MNDITKAIKPTQPNIPQGFIPSRNPSQTAIARSKIKCMTIAFKSLFHRTIALCKKPESEINSGETKLLVAIFKQTLHRDYLHQLKGAVGSYGSSNREDFDKRLTTLINDMSDVDVFKMQKALQKKQNREVFEAFKTKHQNFDIIADLHEQISWRVRHIGTKAMFLTQHSSNNSGKTEGEAFPSAFYPVSKCDQQQKQDITHTLTDAHDNLRKIPTPSGEERPAIQENFSVLDKRIIGLRIDSLKKTIEQHKEFLASANTIKKSIEEGNQDKTQPTPESVQKQIADEESQLRFYETYHLRTDKGSHFTLNPEGMTEHDYQFMLISHLTQQIKDGRWTSFPSSLERKQKSIEFPGKRLEDLTADLKNLKKKEQTRENWISLAKETEDLVLKKYMSQ